MIFKRAFSIFLVLSLVLGATPGWSSPLWSRVGDRVVVSGSKSYGLQALSVSGNREVYTDDNYGFSSRYRNETNLTITGNLLPRLSVTGTVTNNRWNPNDRTMAMVYDGRKTKASLGDITASLTGNELMPFSKRLRGVTVTQNFGICSVTALASRTKAATKTIPPFPGNDTPGPYYLGVSMIVDGSERVKIDEREITRCDSAGMSNYTLDTFSGILTFRDGLIVPSTSTITVSFETQSYNSTPGAIWGLRTDVPISKTLGMGFTYLSQSTGQKPVQYGKITEPFPGNNSMSLPYELLYIPMKSDPPVVKVDGLQQREIEDYTVNYPLKYILFGRTITSSSTILVTYTPQPENAVQGDRSVMGLDGKVKLSNNLTLTGQVARSSSGIGGGKGGGAASVRATGEFGRLTATADIRSISSAFAPVESAGFFRNERGGDLDVRYRFSDSLNWFSRIDRFNRPNYRTADPTAARMVKSTQLMNGLEWKHKKLPQLKLSRTTMDNDNGLDYRDSLTTDAFTANWNIGKVAATGEVNRSNRSGTYLGAGNQLVATNNSSNTSRLSLRYTPGTWFSLSGDVAGSKITGSSTPGTTAKNCQLTARFTPISTVSIDTSYRVADSGGHYDSPYSLVNGGVGTGVGYPGLGYVNSYGLKSVTRMISLNWNPSSRFSFDTSYNYSLSDGVNSTNTSIKGLNLGFTVNPLEILTFRGNVSSQSGHFVGTGGDGNMSSRIGFMSMTVGPLKKLNLDLNYQKMLSDSQEAGVDSPENSRVDLQSLSAVLRRAIGGGRSVFTEYSYSSTSGVVTNNKGALALGVEYPLTDILGLKLDWRIINYTDARNSAYNYRANMLNAQIGARFR